MCMDLILFGWLAEELPYQVHYAPVVTFLQLLDKIVRLSNKLRVVLTGSPTQWEPQVSNQDDLKPTVLNITTNPFELLHKCCNPLENGLLLGQVLGVQRTHFRQDSIKLGSVLAGILSLQ